MDFFAASSVHELSSELLFDSYVLAYLLHVKQEVYSEIKQAPAKDNATAKALSAPKELETKPPPTLAADESKTSTTPENSAHGTLPRKEREATRIETICMHTVSSGAAPQGRVN